MFVVRAQNAFQCAHAVELFGIYDITKRGPSYVFLHSILVRNRLTIDNSKFVEIYSKKTLEYVYIKFMDTPLYREKDQELNNNEFGNKFPPRLVKRNKKKEKKNIDCQL